MRLTARVVFLDVARFLAILFMTFSHVADSLVQRGAWSTGFGVGYAATRGSTAPLFLLVGGWAFAVSSRPHLDAFRRPSRRLLGRVSRVLALCMWGWVLTIPWWHQAFPWGAPEDTWVAFAGLSALHCVGLSLFIAQGVAWVTRSALQLERGLFGLAFVFFIAAPAVFGWADALPWMLQGPFRATPYPPGFPLFPWAGYFFLGGALGLMSARRAWSPTRLAWLLLGLGVTALTVGMVTEGPSLEWLGAAQRYVGPSLMVRRLGVALTVLGLAALATRRLTGLPEAVLVPSRYSLTFYVTHMLLIWGTPWFLGLHHTIGPTLTWAGCAVATVAVLAAQWSAVRAANLIDARAGQGAAALWAFLRAPRPEVAPEVEAAAEAEGERLPVSA